MYIVTVIPIKKGVKKEHLTYFSKENIPLGYIVTVPIRNKTMQALVVGIEDAISLKSDIKNRDYELKKILKISGKSPFDENFLQTCLFIKDYTASNTGEVLNAFLPNIIIDNLDKLNTNLENIIEVKSIQQEKMIFQAPKEDRLSLYKTLIRESFAKKESIIICLPNKYDIEEYKNELAKGIEPYTFIFHSDLSKKAFLENHKEIINETHPVLIILTGTFLSIRRNDVRTIILEHESSESYKQIQKPYVDIRSFVEVLSDFNNWKLIIGDTLLRPETLYRNEIGELNEIHPPTFRITQTERQIVVDMKEELDENNKKSFKIISRDVYKMIENALIKKESVVLFTVRKGLAGTTVCHDCGETLLCKMCSTPMVLYRSKILKSSDLNNRVFMCNKCGRKEDTNITCKNCNSWNLIPLGIGTDRVVDEISSIFKNAKIYQIDKETTKTDKEIKDTINKFKQSESAILIGTEMMFYHLDQKVKHSAIISFDGLLSIPSYNINQKILHLIEKLHNITEKNLIIQTRVPENQILKYILNGNVLPLYREDLRERKEFDYPPFKKLIKITFSGTKQETEKAKIYLDKIFKDYDPEIFSAFISKIKGNYITNTIIRVDRDKWPLSATKDKNRDKYLLENLVNLPFSFSINIEPEDLL